jgi:PAS domain S-box-containing protein
MKLACSSAVGILPDVAASGIGLRVLLVDSDPSCLEALSHGVSEFSPLAEVEVAHSGESAIHQIARTEYDAVISDICTPGIEALAQLARTRKLRRHTPTLLITWREERHLAAQALRGGAYDFLRKPIEPARLREVLERTVQLRQRDTQDENHKRRLQRRARRLKQSLAELRQRNAVIHLLQDIAVSANEATSVQAAVQACLSRLCTRMKWPVGHACLAAGQATGGLTPTNLWHLADPERFAEFRQQSESMSFACGDLLPGTVLAKGKPVWIANLQAEPGFLRGAAAVRVGLQSGMAFPVFAGEQVAAVLEFFAACEITLDDTLVEIMTYVGTQLGEVIKRARAEEALRESETRFRSVAQSAKDAIVSADREGRIVFWNRAAQSMFGFAEDEVLGQPLQTLMPDRYRADHLRALERCNATGELRLGDRTLELHGRRKDGTEFPLEISLAHWTTSKGTFYSAIIRDITHRKRNESHIRTLNEELARRLTEIENISRDASEHKRAEEEVKVSLKQKEVLLREVHHRVKNNLQVICSLLKMQSAHLKDKQAQEVFKETQNRVRSIALVHEKLYRTNDMARLDFAEYLRSLALSLFRSCGVNKDSITLTLDLEPVMLNVETSIPCGLIINELLTNALIHAFPRGRGKIKISLRASEGRGCTLSVSDDGIGMPAGVELTAEHLGWQLISALTEQLKAKVNVRREGGTTVEFSFRELLYKERGW